MKRPAVILVALLLSAWTASVSSAAPRVRPPEFDSEYQLPTTTVPHPRAVFYDYADVGALVAAMSLAVSAKYCSTSNSDKRVGKLSRPT